MNLLRLKSAGELGLRGEAEIIGCLATGMEFGFIWLQMGLEFTTDSLGFLIQS